MPVLTNEKEQELTWKAPDGGWGWVVVIASLLIHFLMDGVTYDLGTFLTPFIQEFNVTHAEASIVHSLLPAVTLFSGPIASIFTNKYGCKRTTVIGAIIASFGFFLSYFVKEFFYFYITIGIISGIGFGLVYVPAIVAVGYYFDEKRSLAMGIAVCGTGLGTSVLSPINRILLDRFGINGSFLIISAILLNLIACGLVIRPVPIEPAEKQKKKEIEFSKNRANKRNVQITTENEKLESTIKKIPISFISNSNKVEDFKAQATEDLTIKERLCEETSAKNLVNSLIDYSLFSDVIFMFFVVSNFLTMLGFYAPYIFIVDQAISLGISPKNADILLSAIGISNTFGRICIGYLGSLKIVNRHYLYASTLALCGISTIIEPFFTGFVGLFVYSISFGFFSGGFVSLGFLLLVDLLGLEKMTNCFGILIMFQGVATAVGPPLAGCIIHVSKSYVLSFMFGGTAITLSGAMSFMLIHIKRYFDRESAKKDQVKEFVKETRVEINNKF